MIKDLVIYGAGGFGREVRLMIEQINADRMRWNVIGFIDDGKAAGAVEDDLEVLGGVKYLQDRSAPLSVVLALAEGTHRKQLSQTLKNAPVDFPILTHPRARLGDTKRNSFGEG